MPKLHSPPKPPQIPQAKSKLIDFNSAYLKRHGRHSLVFSRTLTESRLRAIDPTQSHDPKKIIVEMNLEDTKCKYDYYKEVRKDDLVIVRAGNAEFKLVFTQIDPRGRLEALAFNNGRLDFKFNIPIDGKEKIWSGTLVDFSYFEVHVWRIPTYSKDSEIISNVEITAKVERPVY